MAVASGDIKGVDQISVPMSLLLLEGWQQAAETIAAFPILQGNGSTLDRYVPFNCQVLSKLCKLATKHGLGSPAVANMLPFLTASELTAFNMKQTAKLLCTPVQYTMFESTWRCYAEEHGL